MSCVSRNGNITDHWEVGKLPSLMQQVGGCTPPLPATGGTTFASVPTSRHIDEIAWAVAFLASDEPATSRERNCLWLAGLHEFRAFT
jgi:hypothetical protein